MLKNIPVHGYYFSGTGNTERMATRFMTVLNQQGFKTKLERMESSSRINIEGDYTLGLIFPVAIQATYPLVWSFVENLPLGNGRDVFMFDTMDAFSGGIIGPMKKILKAKGYNCIGAKEFRMSSSMNTSKSKVDHGVKKNNNALLKVENYALNHIDGKTSWRRIPLLSDLMRSFSSRRKVWTTFSKKITVTDDCIGCRICIKKCPTQAIELNSDKVSILHGKCNVCIRCISVCPKNAFRFNNKKLLLSK